MDRIQVCAMWAEETLCELVWSRIVLSHGASFRLEHFSNKGIWEST